KLNYQLPVRPETLGSIDTLLLKNLICQVAN
ncbi:TPA: fimbria/pilus outer membrane usher protein, partial [Escherichia coli]